jgi:acylaminoacyl-peptidase
MSSRSADPGARGRLAEAPMTGSIPLIPRKTLFGNARALNPRLSPDGRWLAWTAAVDGVMNVWVASRDDLGGARPLTRQTGRPILGHTFARTNAHVLFRMDRDGDENFNLWCVGLDRSDARNLTPYREVLARIAGFHDEDPNLIAVGLNDRDARWHDLYVIDIRTAERRLLYENVDEIERFILDRHLNLKLATTTRSKGGGSAILRWTGVAFEEIMSIEADDAENTFPLHIDRSGNAWFLQSSIGRDTAAAFRVDGKTGAPTLIASHAKADVGACLIDPRTREVTAVSVEYLRSEWIALDGAAGRDLALLERELGGTIAIESQSDDDNFWAVAASRPDRPPTYHLLDRGSGRIAFLFSARPELDTVTLAPMREVVIKARDGLDLVSYLTLPPAGAAARPARPLPMVLQVHGGPWGRDGWDYDGDAQWYANRNYAVLQVNYRGSTGFGKAFTNAGDREWGGKMHDDLIDAVNWCIAEGIADPARIAICGHSYGGYAALVGATFTPDVFCCSVALSGIANLETMLAEPPPYWAAFHEQECRRIGDPRTPQGVALLRARSPQHRAAEVTRPMLICHGANDVRCRISESDRMVAALTANRIPVVYVVFPDEGHWLARPENDIAFRAIEEAFLARQLGGRAEPVADDFSGSSHEIRAGEDILRDMLR